jgi:hypothetical protein
MASCFMKIGSKVLVNTTVIASLDVQTNRDKLLITRF